MVMQKQQRKALAQRLSVMMKKPAAANKDLDAENVAADEVDDDVPQDVSKKVQEKQRKQEEQQREVDRKKELKAMSVDDLKLLVTQIGLDPKQKKDALTTIVIKHEAKLRAEARAREAKMRTVVVNKKEELERLSLSDLAKQCASLNIEGAKAKQDRVERILKQWQEADGVAKALEEDRRKEREQELLAMGNAALRKLCEKAGLDPFVKDVLVDRLVRYETDQANQTAKVDQAQVPPNKIDLVETLLLKEKEQKEQKEKQDKALDALAKQKKTLKTMSQSDLKQALSDKGFDSEGNKEALIEILARARLQEEDAKLRKKHLMSMPIPELKQLLASKGIDVSKNNKADLVKMLLDQEALLQKRQLSLEAKEKDAMAARKVELESESQAKLKDLCMSKELSSSGVKEALIGRLLDQARKDGELSKAAAKILRKERKEELSKADTCLVVGMCDKAGVDPCVKEIMVERLLTFETEETLQPPAKRARC
jgi:hypothetical protein